MFAVLVPLDPEVSRTRLHMWSFLYFSTAWLYSVTKVFLQDAVWLKYRKGTYSTTNVTSVPLDTGMSPALLAVPGGCCHDLGLHLLSLSLTLCCTHTHTHMHTDTYTSLSPPPVCYFNQRSRYFAVPPVLTHLISPSILQRLRSWLSVGLLYDVLSMCSFTYLSVEFSYLVLSRLEMLKVSGSFSVSCYRLQWVRSHEVSLDWSPLDLIFLKFCFVISQFCVCARQTALFCSFFKRLC